MRGSVGLARSVLGLGHVSAGAVRQRLEICGQCSHGEACKHNDNQVCRCDVCGCWVKHKARLRGESCPIGRW